MSKDDRRDGANWFVRWEDAVGQADRRAALTRRRYRVYYEPANRWWCISETHTRVKGG